MQSGYRIKRRVVKYRQIDALDSNLSLTLAKTLERSNVKLLDALPRWVACVWTKWAEPRQQDFKVTRRLVILLLR